MQRLVRISISGSKMALASLSLLALLLITLGLGGCAASQSLGSVSDSFGSVSDSLGSFSDSSQSSSGDDTAYREDIRDFTVAHVRAEGSPSSLRLGLSEVALARGISDWEGLPSTFAAVGAGLAAADLAPAALETYQTALAQPGSANHQAMLEGFESFRITGSSAPSDSLNR